MKSLRSEDRLERTLNGGGFFSANRLFCDKSANFKFPSMNATEYPEKGILDFAMTKNYFLYNVKSEGKYKVIYGTDESESRSTNLFNGKVECIYPSHIDGWFVLINREVITFVTPGKTVPYAFEYCISTSSLYIDTSNDKLSFFIGSIHGNLYKGFFDGEKVLIEEILVNNESASSSQICSISLIKYSNNDIYLFFTSMKGLSLLIYKESGSILKKEDKINSTMPSYVKCCDETVLWINNDFFAKFSIKEFLSGNDKTIVSSSFIETLFEENMSIILSQFYCPILLVGDYAVLSSRKKIVCFTQELEFCFAFGDNTINRLFSNFNDTVYATSEQFYYFFTLHRFPYIRTLKDYKEYACLMEEGGEIITNGDIFFYFLENKELGKASAILENIHSSSVNTYLSPYIKYLIFELKIIQLCQTSSKGRSEELKKEFQKQLDSFRDSVNIVLSLLNIRSFSQLYRDFHQKNFIESIEDCTQKLMLELDSGMINEAVETAFKMKKDNLIRSLFIRFPDKISVLFDAAGYLIYDRCLDDVLYLLPYVFRYLTPESILCLIEKSINAKKDIDNLIISLTQIQHAQDYDQKLWKLMALHSSSVFFVNPFEVFRCLESAKMIYTAAFIASSHAKLHEEAVRLAASFPEDSDYYVRYYIRRADKQDWTRLGTKYNIFRVEDIEIEVEEDYESKKAEMLAKIKKEYEGIREYESRARELDKNLLIFKEWSDGIEPQVNCRKCSGLLVNQKVIAFPCGHAFHKECLSQIAEEFKVKGIYREKVDEKIRSDCPFCGYNAVKTVHVPATGLGDKWVISI